MTNAEKDAMLTNEHLKRSSWTARLERRINELAAYIKGKKKTSHILEIQQVIDDALVAIRPGPRDEGRAHDFLVDLDKNLESHGLRTQKTLNKVFFAA